VSSTLLGQRGDPRPGNSTRPFSRTPAMFHHQVTKLGERIRVSGKEATLYTGELVDAAGKNSSAQVIYQTPGLVRLVGFTSGQPLSFDEDIARGVASRDDEVLLETFVMDFPEGMLASVQRSGAVRLLGIGVGPDPRKNPGYSGPRYDIFEVTGPVRTRIDRFVSSKMYYFDSHSGLLIKTLTIDRSRPTPVEMETRFLNWQTIDGSAYPSRIDRFEAGRLVFSFTVRSINAGPAVEAGQFR